MISFKEFLNENSLNEAISKEFKDVAGPLILKEFGDYMAYKGLSVQNANFVKLSNSEKSALKRKLSEKKLDELPFGQRYIVFVRPFSKTFYKDFMNARKNPDPENEFHYDYDKHDSRNLGNITILDRADGTFHNIWMAYQSPLIHNGEKYVHGAPKATSRTENIYRGVTSEFMNLISDKDIVAFVFDTKENDTWKLHNDRYNNKRTNDLLDPNGGSYDSSNRLDDRRRAKLNTIKNSKTNILYTDKIKNIGDKLIKDIQNDIEQFFNDLKSNPKKANLQLTYNFSEKLKQYSYLLDKLYYSYTSNYNYSKEIENALKEFK